MSLELKLDGVDRASLLYAGSLSGMDDLRSASTLEFALVDRTLTYRPTEGEEVTLDIDGTRVFGGYLWECEEFDRSNTENELYFKISCQDYSALARRRIMSATYDVTEYSGAEVGTAQVGDSIATMITGQHVGQVVRRIVETYLAADGFTADATSCPNGILMQKFDFNYCTVGEALDKLAEFAGVSWWISPLKVVNFRSNVGAGPVTLSATSGSKNVRRVTRKWSMQNYRNRQIVRGGYSLTDPISQDSKANGTDRNILTGYEVDSVSGVTVGGVPQSVGIQGVDTAKQWYYQKGHRGVFQDSNETVIANGTIVTVDYVGRYPLNIRKSDSSEVSARAAAENTTGYWDNLDDSPELDVEARIETRVDELLRKYAVIPIEVKLETKVSGWIAGNTATLDIPHHDLSGSGWYVTKCSLYDEGGKVIWYKLELTNAEPRGGILHDINKLTGVKIGSERRDNEVMLDL